MFEQTLNPSRPDVRPSRRPAGRDPYGTHSAGARLRHGTTPAERDQARRDLAAGQIAAAIDKALADAPPLTDAQRVHLAGMLAVAGDVR